MVLWHHLLKRRSASSPSSDPQGIMSIYKMTLMIYQNPRAQEILFKTTGMRFTCSCTKWFKYMFFLKKLCLKNRTIWGFPGGAVVENLPADAGDTGSSPGLGRSHMPRSN